MRGRPDLRATSPDGRWAYTLYDGNGKTPFVHALDTGRASARCIDLDALAGEKYLWDLRLTVGGGGRRLVVRNGLAPEFIVEHEDVCREQGAGAERSAHNASEARARPGRGQPERGRSPWP